MDRVLRAAIFSGLGLGASGGAGFAFVLLMMKMNWLGAPNEATVVLAGTAGEVLGISAWLMITSRLERRRAR